MVDATQVPLRVVVEQPPAGVSFAMQLGRADLLPPVRRRDGELAFEFSLRLKPGTWRKIVFLGPAVHGPPADRFVYVNSGTSAGQFDSPWTRRAKIKLAGIDSTLVEHVLARPGARLEARIAGRGRDGGPACATVPLLGGTWRIVE